VLFGLNKYTDGNGVELRSLSSTFKDAAWAFYGVFQFNAFEIF
jgi:hypothetical protein